MKQPRVRLARLYRERSHLTPTPLGSWDHAAISSLYWAFFVVVFLISLLAMACGFSRLCFGLDEAIRRYRAGRSEMVCIDTLDGLGVIGDAEGTSPRSYDFNRDGAKELAAIRAFAATASYVEKLALCRDAQYTFIFAKDYDHDVQLFVAEMLDSMGLAVEAGRVRGM